MWNTPRAVALMTVSLLIWMNPSQEGLGHDHGHAGPGHERAADAPIRITMKELHEMGGVPPGWTFALPQGDPAKGRAVFVRIECYSCHTIRGESFPREPGQAGPDLTGMGLHHPVAYFAEAIIHPNRVILIGEGYTGPDGLSTMPNYNEDLTVAELIDLVAYLKSLQGNMQHEMKHKTEHGHTH